MGSRSCRSWGISLAGRGQSAEFMAKIRAARKPGWQNRLAQSKKNVRGNEVLFLDAYYSKDSETRGNAVASALKAGYSESTAHDQTARLIKRFGNASAGVSLDALGINKPYLAAKLKELMENGNDKEVLAAVRLSYTLLGESTGEGGQATNVFNAPVMVIQGMTNKRLESLRTASALPTPEEEQLASEQQSAERLELLRQGKLPPIKSHSKATTGYTGWNKNDPNYRGDNELERPDVESGVIEVHPEDEPPAG